MGRKERLLPIDDVTSINAIHIDNECNIVNVNTASKSYEIADDRVAVSCILAALTLAAKKKELAWSFSGKLKDIAHVAIGYGGTLMEVYTKRYSRIAVISGDTVMTFLEVLVERLNGISLWG